MKTILKIVLAILGSATFGMAQPSASPSTATVPGIQSTPPDSPYAIVSRSANEQVWEKTTYVPGPNGTSDPKKLNYVEMATGLNFLSNGQYVASQELIEPTADGAIAQRGQHRVVFAGNLNTTGAVDLQMPDGKHLRSNILGLEYYDTSTGTGVLIAQVQDSAGEIISSNQVLYPNAFSGVNASVRYTYKASSFEQDVILDSQIPSPESLNLDPDTTKLMVLTEFLNPPAANVAGISARTGNLEPDQDISWGSMSLGFGRAFDLGQSGQTVPVVKQYGLIQGRMILFEEVPVKSIQPQLEALPVQTVQNTKTFPTVASKAIQLPGRPLAKARTEPMRLAEGRNPRRGLVLDYITLNSSQTNVTFQADTTYLISGTVNTFGVTTWEGGTVLKFPQSSGAINAYGPVICATSPYREAVLTAVDNSSVGQAIGTGSPSGYYGDPAQSYFTSWSSAVDLEYLRVSYANCGVLLANSGTNDILRHCQFLRNSEDEVSIYAGVNIGNCLFCNSGSQTFFAGANLNLVNVTVHNTLNLLNGGGTIAITNSLLVGVTNWVLPFTSVNNATNSSDTGVFQTVGAGANYLPVSSAYHNHGTINVDPILAGQLQQKTTYPPMVYSNVSFGVPLNFAPVVPRDTNVLDLGYHYDPLDYVFGGVNMYSNVTFAAGTAVGWFELPGSGGPGFGISIWDNVVLALNGTASQPCTLARYSTVQEGGTGLWADKGWLAAIAAQSLSGGYSMPPANAAQVWPKFTRHSDLAGGANAYREYNALIKVVGQNSEFWDCGAGAYWAYLNFTNCLFDRGWLNIVGGNAAICGMRNCTMRGSNLTLSKNSLAWPVWVEECAFDNTTLQVDDNSGGNTNITYCDFNAYITTNSNRLPMVGTHTVTVPSFKWQVGYLGTFYQPSNSLTINAGSTTADQFGLYHYSVMTNLMNGLEVKETNSPVDIGYHYVATDAHDNPIDSNGNGIPDYIEDASGTGLPLRITLLTPLNGSFYVEPANVSLQATVSDWSGTVTNVSFLQGETQITGVTNAPFQYNWPLVAAGAYSVTATAQDNRGANANSSAAGITVTNLCGY